VFGQAVASEPRSFFNEHQWLADGLPIPGATGSAFIPAAEQAGQRITVRVTLAGSSTMEPYTIETGYTLGATPAPTPPGTPPIVAPVTGTQSLAIEIVGDNFYLRTVAEPAHMFQVTPASGAADVDFTVVWYIAVNGSPVQVAVTDGEGRIRVTDEMRGRHVAARITANVIGGESRTVATRDHWVPRPAVPVYPQGSEGVFLFSEPFNPWSDAVTVPLYAAAESTGVDVFRVMRYDFTPLPTLLIPPYVPEGDEFAQILEEMQAEADALAEAMEDPEVQIAHWLNSRIGLNWTPTGQGYLFDVPLLVHVRGGEVIAWHQGTVDGHVFTDTGDGFRLPDLTFEQASELFYTFRDILTGVNMGG
jgi:hypothetical protein